MLPISAIVNGQYLCMHGGISESLKSIDDTNKIDRKQEPPQEDCLLADLLWADPAGNRETANDYVFNEKRSVSVIFGKRPANKLLAKSNLKAIIRAHECK